MRALGKLLGSPHLAECPPDVVALIEELKARIRPVARWVDEQPLGSPASMLAGQVYGLVFLASRSAAHQQARPLRRALDVVGEVEALWRDSASAASAHAGATP